MRKEVFSWLGVVLLSLFLGACAKPEPRILWPPPPNDSKLEFIGTYHSEQNFEKTFWTRQKDVLTGETSLYPFRSPYGIVADGKGRVYVADLHVRNVRIFDFNNRTVEILSKEQLFASPHGMAFDAAGNLYVCDPNLSKVLVFDRNRAPIAVITEKLERPSYVSINDKVGRIYVSDAGYNAIQVFDMEGHFQFSIGEGLPEDIRPALPQGMAWGPDGNLYVADRLGARIQVFDPDGKPVYRFGERGDGAGQFEAPKDLAFDSEGHLYIVDQRRPAFYTYTKEGQLLLVTGGTRIGTNMLGFGMPTSIYIDQNDRIYIADMAGKKFAVWQYLNKDYLATHPIDDASKKATMSIVSEEEKKEGE